MAHEDQDLRERFAALRREDAGRTTRFAVPGKQRAAAPRPVWLPAIALAVLVVVGAGTFLFTRQQRREPPFPDRPITQWKSPTDFLLQTPGREVLRNVPVFTRWPESVAVPAATPKPFSKKKS
jgi:hypothetical protein